MLICINAKEAEELNTFLLSTRKKTLLIHEEMRSSNILGTKITLFNHIKNVLYYFSIIFIFTDNVINVFENLFN